MAASSGLLTIALGLVAVHLVIVVLLLRWRWQRRERLPVEEKPLRAPGERLRQRLDRLEERCAWLVLSTTLVPSILLIAGLHMVHALPSGTKSLATLIVTFVCFVASAAGGAWLLLRAYDERRSLRRSLHGDRIVADSLNTLVPLGYRVFHDVPTLAGVGEDHVHHVVVGPAGVFAVHTQTHSRRTALPGRKEHEIIFDGDQLVYPWGQDTQGIVPARRNAEWLSDWIFQLLGERVPVAAVLTFPGWWVTPITQRDVRVHNPGQIAALIQDSSITPLTERHHALIVRQLEDRCRHHVA